MGQIPSFGHILRDVLIFWWFYKNLLSRGGYPFVESPLFINFFYILQGKTRQLAPSTDHWQFYIPQWHLNFSTFFLFKKILVFGKKIKFSTFSHIFSNFSTFFHLKKNIIFGKLGFKNTILYMALLIYKFYFSILYIYKTLTILYVYKFFSTFSSFLHIFYSIFYISKDPKILHFYSKKRQIYNLQNILPLSDA